MIPKLFFKLENKKFESNLNYFLKKKTDKANRKIKIDKKIIIVKK